MRRALLAAVVALGVAGGPGAAIAAAPAARVSIGFATQAGAVPQSRDGQIVSANYFDVLGVEPERVEASALPLRERPREVVVTRGAAVPVREREARRQQLAGAARR